MGDSTRLKVSIVMPVYNQEKYVSKAIESILTQTFEDFEFLIIDDGSSDGTLEILRGYKDPRMRIVVNKANIGLTKSLNKGLGVALGKYIARQDGDDISLPKRLEKQFRFLEKHREYGLVGCCCHKIDSAGNVTGSIMVPTRHHDIAQALVKTNQFVHSSVMFRKECIEKLGPYDETLIYSQDYELWLRISSFYKVANLKEVLHCWRYSETGISRVRFEEQEEYARLIRARFLQKREEGASSTGEREYKLGDIVWGFRKKLGQIVNR